MDHWVELRTHLTRLLRQRELLEPVSIRCFPEAWVRDKRVLAKVRKRYGLSAVMHVTVSPESETSDKPRWRYAIELSGDNVPKEFAIATTAHARALIGREPSGIHLLELLHWRAGRLAECFLLHMAVLEYCEKRYESAAALLRALDESIGPRLSVDAPPRLQIRYLESLSLTDPSAFAGDAPPGPDELAHAIGRCEEAARRFGHQFSHVFARQGRNLYYAGRLDDALKMTERALSTARDDTGRVLAKLNIAVLQLLLANWKNAEASFRALFQETSWNRFA